MHSLHLSCRTPAKDLLLAELYERDTLGVHEIELPDSEWELDAWFDERFDVSALADYSPSWRDADNRDWVEESQRQWQPLAVGRRLWLAPEWITDAPPDGRIRLTIYPGDASGSGYSEPTQLALEAIEEHISAGATVVDVGAGSGILTAAASLLGASKLIACDIDADAARSAADNLRRGHVPAEVFAGTPRSLQRAVADLVIANLNAIALLASATELARVVRPEGKLILSGFRERRARDIRRAFEPRGLLLRDDRSRGDWRCFVLSTSL